MPLCHQHLPRLASSRKKEMWTVCFRPHLFLRLVTSPSGGGRGRRGASEPYSACLASALMHLAHSTCFTMRPFFMIDTFCRLGLKARFVARWENERLCPNEVVLPQFAHLAIVQDPFNDSQSSVAPSGQARHCTIEANGAQDSPPEPRSTSLHDKIPYSRERSVGLPFGSGPAQRAGWDLKSGTISVQGAKPVWRGVGWEARGCHRCC